jgi:hypothetical protein
MSLEYINQKFLEASLEESPTIEESEYPYEEEFNEDLSYLDEIDTKKERKLLKEFPSTHLILDRLPPQSLVAERAILGIYLVNPNKRGKHDKNLSDKFYADANKKLHKTMTKLKNLDLILLQEKLREQGNDEATGGMAYLTELYRIGENTNPNHLLDYVKIVRKKALRRDLIHASIEGLRDAFDPQEKTHKIIKRLYSKLSKMKGE